MPKLDGIHLEEENILESRPIKSNYPKKNKYQKKMDMYIDLYEFLKESKNEMYIPLFDVSRFTSHSVKCLVKD